MDHDINAVTIARRSKTGCQMCRRRKKKCDEQRPVCNGCKKNDLACSWDISSRVRKPQRHRQCGFNKDFMIPPEIGSMVTVFAAPSNSMTQRLLSHFITCSPTWLSITKDSRQHHFLHHIIPSAMENPVVLNCLLAVAAADLCKVGDDAAELEKLSHEYHAQAVRGVSAAIGEELKVVSSSVGGCSSDDTLLAVLLLCVHEAVNFTHSDRLILHINASAILTSHRLDSIPNNADMRGFLFEVFCYFFTLTASTHGYHAELEVSLAYEVFKSPYLREHQSQGMLLGTYQDLFQLILRLSILPYSAVDSMSDSENLHSELLAVESGLWDFWTKTTATSYHDLKNPELVLISELYCLACQLYVKSFQLGLSIRDTAIQNIVSAFITTLEMTSPTSPANGVLCWPLVIVGLFATVGTHRRLISARLSIINDGWRSDIPSQSAKFLTRKWKEDKKSEADTSSTGNVLPGGIRMLRLPAILV